MAEFVFQNFHCAVQMPFLPKNDGVIDMQIRLFRRCKSRKSLYFFEYLQRLIKMSRANQQHTVSAQQTRLVHPLFIGFVVKLHRLFIFVFSMRGKRFVADHIAHKTHGIMPP